MAPETSLRIRITQRAFVESASVQERIDSQACSVAIQPDIPALNALALRSLGSLYEAKEQLFSRCVTLTEDGFHREESSRKRTIIALLGLQRLANSGETPSFDMSPIRESVLADTSWVKSAGDLGLLAWFTAECAPDTLGKLLEDLDFEKALDTYSDGRQACTRGLAWFLAGIAHARLSNPGNLPDLTDVAVDAYHLLQDNQSEGGIFGNGASPGFLREIFCNRIGTFTDQIYSIYAMTMFARAFQIEEPLGSALSCANAVRALQGDLGQWWYLYDKRGSRVVNRYPLFSLHQEGIAPLGLLALGEATGQDFHESIYKGLTWSGSANELGHNDRNVDHGLRWDSIGPSGKLATYWEGARSLLKLPQMPEAERLKVRYAARPDHFGWILYAFGQFGLPKAASAAAAPATQNL